MLCLLQTLCARLKESETSYVATTPHTPLDTESLAASLKYKKLQGLQQAYKLSGI